MKIRYEANLVLFQYVGDPSRLPIGRVSKRKDRRCSFQLVLIAKSIVCELSEAVAHPVDSVADVAQALRFHEDAAVPELGKQIDVIVIRADSTVRVYPFHNERENVLVIRTRALL